MDILPSFLPYTLVVAAFAAFVLYNGGIVLGMLVSNEKHMLHWSDSRAGDKANHIPAFHIPQIYYFVAFSTAFGWPVLICNFEGPRKLIHDVWSRMFGSNMYLLLVSSLFQVLKLLPAV